MEENYNTLIKQAVRAVLKPKGMFQKGSTRILIDDNGWFFTVVEFQGSWCDRGTYLNIGMQHLWKVWAGSVPQAFRGSGASGGAVGRQKCRRLQEAGAGMRA